MLVRVGAVVVSVTTGDTTMGNRLEVSVSDSSPVKLSGRLLTTVDTTTTRVSSLVLPVPVYVNHGRTSSQGRTSGHRLGLSGLGVGGPTTTVSLRPTTADTRPSTTVTTVVPDDASATGVTTGVDVGVSQHPP